MRYNQFIELSPQSFACFDEAVAESKKGQNQTNENEVPHGKFPPILFSILNLNHWGIHLLSKAFPKRSRRSQFSICFFTGIRNANQSQPGFTDLFSGEGVKKGCALSSLDSHAR